MPLAKPNNQLNDSIVLIDNSLNKGTHSKQNSNVNGQPQRKSIQQIMNTVFDDSQSIPQQNNSQLSQKQKAGSSLVKMQNSQLSM